MTLNPFVLTVMMATILSGCATFKTQKAPGSESVLRVACDPNNFPFSSQEKDGFENDIAQLIAKELGKSDVQTIWWSQKQGFMRNTLKASDPNYRADLVMGSVAGNDTTETTDAYYRSSYVMVYREDKIKDLTSLDDPRLRQLKIGIHLLGNDYENPPPARALANRNIIDNVVGYSTVFHKDNPANKIITDLEEGKIDVVLAWGPSIGYFIKSSKRPLKMFPLIGGKFDPPFVFDITMAVNDKNDALRQNLNAIIKSKKKEITAILENYGVPLY